MDGVMLTPLKIIDVINGNVLHAMKYNDPGYKNFGEVYFSIVKHGAVKGWKKHHHMTLNLVVPKGKIQFVLYNGNQYLTFYLSQKNYQRLTVPPGIWLAFRGISTSTNMLLNIADIPHDPSECIIKDLTEFCYEW